uniref:isoamylase n=2 Tax=Rhodosorus marinus TaxID=101924 RepID=A0A7S3EBS1_9RHOD|mmetsp:Transcript_21155/g.86371  ORF Transcript_21155/g.86371 Transcript_21155/m.86371 type:complete len:707 (+) Transcript_21155:346-2466(+)
MARVSFGPPDSISGNPSVTEIGDGDLKSHVLVARGYPLPLGLSARGEGANFAVYSRESEDFSLVLYPPETAKDSKRIEIKLSAKFNRTGQVWHVMVSPYCEGYSYMYRVGTAEKSRWKKDLVMDPVSYCLDSPRGPQHFNNIAGGYRPRSVIMPKKVFDFDWRGVLPPRIPMKDLVIYEMHVRGFTMSPDSGCSNPGSYLGIVEKIPYLKSLGVNCVELLPVMEFNETEWDKKNPFTGKPLCQYWGYSTVNFFSPMNRYAVGSDPWSALDEFKTMVRELHRAGIEVFLDVVFNHTAEFGESFLGPGFFSFKGLATETYYITKRGKFHDYTGCGNSVSLNNPIVAEWFHSCIRYWVHEMGIDGFRFDLASEMTRSQDGTPLDSPPAIERITKDPTLRDIKFIAEPWDAVGLYQVGKFPHFGHWGEWNGKYRDCVRKFIKGDQGTMGEFATRICGSADLYQNGRKPFHSINFIVAHDGFSLFDLASYNEKHNQENGENNNDGEKHNNSWNCGLEGETGQNEINTLRHRQCKNFMVALMMSAGTPMILMGDEYCHSKGGNNNAWCQDQQKNYFHWNTSKAGHEMRRFMEKLIDFRKRHKILCRDEFLNSKDIRWHGSKPFKPEWDSGYNFLAFTFVDHQKSDDLYVAFNAGHHHYGLTLPNRQDGRSWYRIIDTNLASPKDFATVGGHSSSAESEFSLHGKMIRALIDF